MRQNDLKTSKSKGVIIFSLVVLLLSVGLLLLFILNNEPWPIRIVVIIFASIFIAVALFMLLTQVGNYLLIRDGYIYRSIFFVRKKTKLEKIKLIKYKDNVYYLYLKSGKRFAVLNAYDPLASEFVLRLEKAGAKTN